MADKQVIVNVEAQKEELDLTLRLGSDKGKRPIDGSPESKKRKRNEKDLEDVSTDRSSEDKFSLLEEKLAEMERLVNRRADELAEKIDQYFAISSKYNYNQHAHHIDVMTKIESSLQQIALSLSPGTFSGLQRFTSRPGTLSLPIPRSSSSKPETSSQKPPRP